MNALKSLLEGFYSIFSSFPQLQDTPYVKPYLSEDPFGDDANSIARDFTKVLGEIPNE